MFFRLFVFCVQRRCTFLRCRTTRCSRFVWSSTTTSVRTCTRRVEWRLALILFYFFSARFSLLTLSDVVNRLCSASPYCCIDVLCCAVLCCAVLCCASSLCFVTLPTTTLPAHNSHNNRRRYGSKKYIHLFLRPTVFRRYSIVIGLLCILRLQVLL